MKTYNRNITVQAIQFENESDYKDIMNEVKQTNENWYAEFTSRGTDFFMIIKKRGYSNLSDIILKLGDWLVYRAGSFYKINSQSFIKEYVQITDVLYIPEEISCGNS